MQPTIRTVKTRRRAIQTFKGLCLRDTVPEGYFSDAENLTSAGYPAIVPRRARGVIGDCDDVTAMFSHDEMVWLEGTNLFYGSSYVGQLAAGEKRFASMGAEIAIFPDKVILNSRTRTLANMENAVTVSGVTAESCDLDGNPMAATPYAKISANGIGAGFSKGDGVQITGFSDENRNGSYVLQTVDDDFLVVLMALDLSVSEAGSVTVSRSAPDLDFVCALGNRLWGCAGDGHEVYACKLGDATNWNVFEGLSTDSYVATVPSSGVFTGCAAYLGNVTFFKEEEIIKVYGSKPSNFELVTSEMPGVAKDAPNSLAFCSNRLFYKGLIGVYAYDGSAPVCVSQALGDRKYQNACAGAFNGRYYMSAYDTLLSEYRLLVYDADTGLWLRENGGRAIFFAGTGSELYVKFADNKICTVEHGGLWYNSALVPSPRMMLNEGRYEWNAVTGPIALCSPNGQYASRLHLRFSLGTSASLTVYSRVNDDSGWTENANFTDPHGEITVTIPLPVRRASTLYLKLTGVNSCVISQIALSFEAGGDA